MEDINQQITDQIIEQMEAGTAPWNAGRSVANTLPLRHKGEHYNGVNVLILWSEAAKKGYINPNWMTFQQAKDYGGMVRKGEKSARAVFAKTLQSTDEETGEIKSTGGFLKRYAVFNAGQIDNLPEGFYEGKPLATYENNRIEEIDAFIEATGATVVEGTSPCHYPAKNTIEMPPFDHYESGENYYHDLLHELTHWTRVSNRLDRNCGQKKKFDNGYIKEELVAEIGTSFLLAHFGLAVPIRNSAAYMNEHLEEYVSAMRQDKKLIVSAASHASKALNYLLALAVANQEQAA